MYRPRTRKNESIKYKTIFNIMRSILSILLNLYIIETSRINTTRAKGRMQWLGVLHCATYIMEEVRGSTLSIPARVKDVWMYDIE